MEVENEQELPVTYTIFAPNCLSMRQRAAGKLNRVGRPKQARACVDADKKICSAALDLFAARNFSAVTIKDISCATGFNTALIYYYFGSKEDLFQQAVTMAVDRAFEQFRMSRDATKPPQEAIFDWLDTHIRDYATIAKLIKISIDYASTADRKPAIDRAIRQFYDQERDALRAALRAGVVTGTTAKVDVDAIATFISTYLDGVFVRAMVLKDFKPIEAIAGLKPLLIELLRPDRPAGRRMRAQG